MQKLDIAIGGLVLYSLGGDVCKIRL